MSSFFYIFQVLRASMSRLQNSQSTRFPPSSVKEELDYKRRSKLYRTNLKVTREQLHASALRDRQLLTESLSLWTQLKEVRVAQGYCASTLSLAISTEEVNWKKFLLFCSACMVFVGSDSMLVRVLGKKRTRKSALGKKRSRKKVHWKKSAPVTRALEKSAQEKSHAEKSASGKKRIRKKAQIQYYYINRS